MARRKGSGKMAQKLRRTRSGSRPRRRTVKLDTKGLKKFQNILGKGVTFKLGLFNAKAAQKGLYLEFGTDNQVARPWLSSVLKPGRTRRELLKTIRYLVRDALKGENSKQKVSKKMVPILQQHLLKQRFQAQRLTDSTIRQKRAKGNADPTLIGIDTFHLATMLDVRAIGGRQHRSKK
jgi:hypothetical protein